MPLKRLGGTFIAAENPLLCQRVDSQNRLLSLRRLTSIERSMIFIFRINFLLHLKNFLLLAQKKVTKKRAPRGGDCPLKLLVNILDLVAFAVFASRKCANGGAVIRDGSLLSLIKILYDSVDDFFCRVFMSFVNLFGNGLTFFKQGVVACH